MILKNKLTKETLDIPYSEFMEKFAKEIRDAFESYRKKFDTKKEADSMFLDLYNSGMYLPKVFKFIETISIGTLHGWVKNYERY